MIAHVESRNCAIPGDAKCQDNGTCIRSNMVCNGISNCMDGSDETDCGMYLHKCMHYNQVYREYLSLPLTQNHIMKMVMSHCINYY